MHAVIPMLAVMTTKVFLDLLNEAIWLTLTLSMPILMVGLIVGVSISLIQAVTQVQESTLTFVPKIFASMVVLVILSPWMVSLFLEHTQRFFEKLTTITH